MKIKKVLIVNRGEIACRIIRYCKKANIRSVAIYSEADKKALHTLMADEAYPVGPALAAQSYLNIDKILNVARKSHVDAIHPGYGFLSENPEFADACEKSDFIFIGPSAKTIEQMGNKSNAKKLMEKARIPTLPSYNGSDQSVKKLKTEARNIGFPILIKAVYGGGGKGMRIVYNENELETAIQAAKRESKSSFTHEEILLEAYLNEARHIEVQIAGDKAGNIIHIFERDCSIQRRYQKIIEESPAPFIETTLRQAICNTGVLVGKTINYFNVGTVEFLLDKQNHFYFLEVNTRLQVEHPVTEMVSGIDLVELQFHIAEGKLLPFTQTDLKQQGHSIEARIYAESSEHNFLPSTGTILYLQEPALNENVRLDTGIKLQDQVTSFYDPLLAKLIVWGKTRDDAITLLQASLNNYEIYGIHTNSNLLYKIISHPNYHHALQTNFIEHNNILQAASQVPIEKFITFAAFSILQQRKKIKPNHHINNDIYSPWHTSNAWSLYKTHVHHMVIEMNNQSYELSLEVSSENEYHVHHMHDVYTFKYISTQNNLITLEINNEQVTQKLVHIENNYFIINQCECLHFRDITHENFTSFHAHDDSHLYAPIPGMVVEIFVKEGDFIEAGTPLIVLEAMKMEHAIKAPMKGKVKNIFFQKGSQVTEGAELIELDTTN